MWKSLKLVLIRALYWLANAYLVRKVQIKSWLWWTLRSLANEQIQHTCDAESRNQTWDTQVVCNHPYHCTRPPSCTLHGFNEIKTLFFLNRKSSNEASSGCYHGTLLDDAIEQQRLGPFDSILPVVVWGLIWTFLFCKNTIEGKLLKIILFILYSSTLCSDNKWGITSSWTIWDQRDFTDTETASCGSYIWHIWWVSLNFTMSQRR